MQRNDDSLRYNLVVQLACAKCGARLQMSYRAPSNTQDYDKEHYDDKLSGAEKVGTLIAVHPCSKCYGEERQLREGLRDIFAKIIPIA